MSLKRSLGLLLALTAVISCLVFPTKSLAASGDVEINAKNFPDAAFREILTSSIDKNGDKILSEEERYDIKLDLVGVNDFTGMSYFKDIYFLQIKESNVEKLSFDFSFSKLYIMMISKCPELKEIGKIQTSKDLALMVSYCPKLTTFNAYDTRYSHLEFSCYALESIDLSDVTYLKGLYIYQGQSLTSLDISHCKESLENLFVYSAVNLKTLDVSGCPRLAELLLGGSELEKLDISNCPNLNSVETTSDSLTELDLRKTYYINYCVLHGTRVEDDLRENCCVYKTGESDYSYVLTVPKKTKLITVDVDAGVKVSDIVEDPELAEKVAKICDTDKNGLITESERVSLKDLYFYSENTVTTLKDLTYFTNLEIFESDSAIFDTFDLNYLPCTQIKLIRVKANEIIIPDNTKITSLDIRGSYFGSDTLYLGQQEDLHYINYDFFSIAEKPEKLIKVLDVSDCPYIAEGCKHSIRMIYTHDDGSKSIEYRMMGSGETFIETSDETRIKYGKDIIVSAQHGTVTGAGNDLDLGSEVYLKQKPDEGYLFKGWYESGKFLSDKSELRVRVTGDRRFVAKYEPDPSYVPPTATPTPKVTATPKVTSAPKPTTVSPEDPKAQILDFVKRIYVYVLDREPEAEGAAFWSDELWNFRRTGAEVAQGFIFSPEFENRNTSDQQFVTILYKTFFGREAEEGGMNFWLAQLSTGTMDRVTVANGFIYSQEWADTCASYGIRSGGDLKPTGTITPSELTYAFVERMYTTALGRGYDEEGKQYWASELANFNVSGESVGASFFLSDEMNGYNLSDEDFLGRLYATFMDREPDTDGKAYWLGVISSGASRSDVVFGFTRSPEFTNKCVEARILPF